MGFGAFIRRPKVREQKAALAKKGCTSAANGAICEFVDLRMQGFANALGDRESGRL